MVNLFGIVSYSSFLSSLVLSEMFWTVSQEWPVASEMWTMNEAIQTNITIVTRKTCHYLNLTSHLKKIEVCRELMQCCTILPVPETLQTKTLFMCSAGVKIVCKETELIQAKLWARGRSQIVCATSQVCCCKKGRDSRLFAREGGGQPWRGPRSVRPLSVATRRQRKADISALLP